MTRYATIFCVSLAACADAPTVTPDYGDPDAGVIPAHRVELYLLSDPPLFMRYRAGDGPWQEPIGNMLWVDDRYELVTVCERGDGTLEVAVEATTYADSYGYALVDCYSYGPTQTSRVAVTGTMMQPGTVHMRGSQSSETANWTFTLDVPLGNHDLIATSATRAVIRRGVSIAGPTSMPMIDVAGSEGVTLSDVTIDVTGVVTGETVRTRTSIFTAGAYATIAERSGANAILLPATALLAADHQSATVEVTGDTHFRSAYFSDENVPAALTLLPRLADIELTGTTASWTKIPTGDVELELTSGSLVARVKATEGWLGTQTSLALDTSTIPDFSPAWTLGALDSAYIDVSTFGNGVQHSGLALEP